MERIAGSPGTSLGAPRVDLEALWKVGGCLKGILEHVLVRLERLWGSLGASLKVRGASLGALGDVLG